MRDAPASAGRVTMAKEWTTAKSLEAIRGVFKKLGWRFTEVVDDETNFFSIEADGELERIQAVYQPGTLAIYLVFGVKAAKTREAELMRFAAVFNNMTHSGCLLVRSSETEKDKRIVLLRGTLDHRHVRDVEERYVASMISELIDLVPVVDRPLILIAKGATADKAILETLDASVVPIEAKAKSGQAARKRR